MCQAGVEDSEALADLWRRTWDEHLADVRKPLSEFPGQLIEFNLDTESVETLVAVLPQYGLDVADWGDTGNTRQRVLHPVTAALKRYWAHVRPRNFS